MLRQSSGPPTSNSWCCKELPVPVLSSRLCLYPWPSGLARRSISSDRVHGRVRSAGRRHLFDPLVSVDDDYEDCQKLLASCMHRRPVKLGPKERGIRSSCLASGVNPSRLMKRKSRLNATTVHGAGCCRLHATRCLKMATGDESATPCHVFSGALTLNEFVILYRWNSCLARNGISQEFALLTCCSSRWWCIYVMVPFWSNK